MGVGLLVLRLILGAIFLAHGTQKLFGWFGGGGPEGTADMVGALGYRSSRTMALVAGAAEAVGGLLVLLGLFTPLGCVAIIGVMTNAILAVHAPKGFWNARGGVEFPLTLLVVAAALGFTGPGRISIDKVMSLIFHGPVSGIVVLLAGIVVGLAVFAFGRYRPEEIEETRPLRPAA